MPSSTNSLSMILDASPGAIAVTPPNGTTCSGSPLVCTVSGTSALGFTLTVADAHGTMLADNTIPGSPVLSVVSNGAAIATVTTTQAPYGIHLTPVAFGTASITVTASPATGTSGLSPTTLTFTANVVGQVTTFAGNPVTYGTINGPGSTATFYGPGGVAFDTFGNLYVADMYNNEIREITPAAVVSTFAGNPAHGSTNATGALASFYRPDGIALDAKKTRRGPSPAKCGDRPADF